MKVTELAIFRRGLILLAFAILPSGILAAERFQLTTRSDHPIGDVCRALEAQFHWRISYEDAPVFDQDELKNGAAPNGVPWRILRDVPAAVDVPIETNMPAIARGKTLQSILDSHRRNGGRAALQSPRTGILSTSWLLP